MHSKSVIIDHCCLYSQDHRSVKIKSLYSFTHAFQKCGIAYPSNIGIIWTFNRTESTAVWIWELIEKKSPSWLAEFKKKNFFQDWKHCT